MVRHLAWLAVAKRLWRAGAFFDCPVCGELLKDDDEHYPPERAGSCPECGGRLKLVALGDPRRVQDANWFRCLDCRTLFMRRRGETVPTQPKMGFEEFATF